MLELEGSSEFHLSSVSFSDDESEAQKCEMTRLKSYSFKWQK